jgi:hypothetical protein
MVQKYIASQHERNKNKSILLPSFGKQSQYVLSRILYNQKLQEKNHEFKGKDMIPYRYPNCLTGEAWDVYTNNPFNLSTRKEFLSTISLSCIDKKKDTKMTPPYALALENVTTDVGPISSHRRYGASQCEAQSNALNLILRFFFTYNELVMSRVNPHQHKQPTNTTTMVMEPLAPPAAWIQ